MLESRFKVLMSSGKFVDTNLLETGIYPIQRPHLFEYDETLESLKYRVSFWLLTKLKEMEIKYSKEQFEGFTHRFIVKLKVDNDWRNDTNIHLYSNSDSYQNLEDFINEKKSNKVIAFDIVHRATKEQDEMASKLIDETLNGL